jgi:hypothetical protein
MNHLESLTRWVTIGSRNSERGNRPPSTAGSFQATFVYFLKAVDLSIDHRRLGLVSTRLVFRPDLHTFGFMAKYGPRDSSALVT